MKKILPVSTKLAAVLSALCYLAVNNAKAVPPNAYFDVNGATAGYGVAASGSYSWDGANWATVTGGAAATSTYVGGSFARFMGAASYTVTVNGDESIAGMYEDAAGTLTINSAGVGTLDVATGDQGFLTLSGSTTVINAVISGSGGVAPESSGTLYLNGNNTYTGGTTFGYSGTPLTYFNNANSFGTGALKFIQASGVAEPILGYGGATITLANPVISTVSGQIVNFAASASTPVVSTGSWTLAGNTMQIKNNGAASSPLTISGSISGTAGATFTGANGGTINLTGVNSLSGAVTVGTSGAAAITLKLGTAGTLASATGIVMNGGKLDFGGNAQTFASMATLTLSANSTMDFESGGTATFANSSAITWSGTLNLLNYTDGDLTVGTDASGLTSGQIAELLYNGQTGDFAINSLGQIVVVPEPSSIALGVFGALGLVYFAKRKQA